MYGSGPRFPAEVGSDAATCPVAPDLTSRLRWALAPPRVPRLQTSLPCWDGRRRRHISYGFRSRFPTEKDSDAVMCHVVFYGPHVTCIKKGIADLPM
jgi:hypothetical protein